MTSTVRICSICRVTLPLACFSQNSWYCRPCKTALEMARQRRQAAAAGQPIVPRRPRPPKQPCQRETVLPLGMER